MAVFFDTVSKSSWVDRDPPSEHPPSRPTRRKRRTQEERSAETRALLLDATIECLSDLGYAKTTAQVIADRAGLSRGAQLHHFGGKEQLVTAAMEHIFETRHGEFLRAFSDRPPDSSPLDAAIDLLWRTLSGPTGVAYMELAWAARTDPELREAMIALTHRMDMKVQATFSDLFGEGVISPSLDLAWTVLFCVLEGLIVENVVRPDEKLEEKVIPLIKQVLPMLLG